MISLFRMMGNLVTLLTLGRYNWYGDITALLRVSIERKEP